MRQLLVGAVDCHGRFKAINAISSAARLSGFRREDVIGKHLWDFGQSADDTDLIRRKVAECLFDGQEPQYSLRSHIDGREEHWKCTLIPVDGCAMMCVSREMFPKRTIHVGDDDLRVLQMLIDDKSVAEIADAIGCSPNTLSMQLKRLRDRCGVRTNHGLVAWTIRYGVI